MGTKFSNDASTPVVPPAHAEWIQAFRKRTVFAGSDTYHYTITSALEASNVSCLSNQ